MSSRTGRSGTKTYYKTFTYYLPAPPSRKSGYRERELDKILQGYLESGFELHSLNTESISHETGGMYVLAVFKTRSKKVADLDRDQDLQEKYKLSHTHSSPDIVLDEEEDA
ncbi:MAG TPA: hypothetical protein VNJ01_02385 [Bacteriovoracaceae bacterium]|nr:hypothetical protein [Bacteriovoracaceae bacterium]